MVSYNYTFKYIEDVNQFQNANLYDKIYIIVLYLFIYF